MKNSVSLVLPVLAGIAIGFVLGICYIFAIFEAMS